MTNTAIKLATIQAEIGEMALSLEDRDEKRVLIARTENGTEELVADQPHEGYAAGDPGIVDALENIQDWYSGATWQLGTLVDWRDYVGSLDAARIAEKIAAEELTIEQAAQKTGCPIINGCLVPEPGKWHADDGNAEMVYETETGEEAAEEYVETGEWGDRTETTWITVSAWREGINAEGETVRIDEERHTITLEAEEPACTDSDGHDWQSPYEIVGGIKENPGVWGHGGGTIHHEACLRCGCGRTTDNWAQNPSTGEQGLTSVAYKTGKYAAAIAGDEEEDE